MQGCGAQDKEYSNSYSSFINQQFFMILFSKNCNLRERNPCMRGLLNVSIILSKFIYHVKAMHLSEFLVEGQSCTVYHSFYLNQLETILDINDVNKNGNLQQVALQRGQGGTGWDQSNSNRSSNRPEIPILKLIGTAVVHAIAD